MARMGFWVRAKRVGGASVGNMFLAFRSPATSSHVLYCARFERYRNFFGVPLRGSSDDVHCWSRYSHEVDDSLATSPLDTPWVTVWFKVLGDSDIEMHFDVRAGHGPQWGRLRRTFRVFTYKPQRPGQRNYFDYLGPLEKVYHYRPERGTEEAQPWMGEWWGSGWMLALAGDNLCTRDYIDTLVRNTLFEEW
jgi:hypothetical protein